MIDGFPPQICIGMLCTSTLREYVYAHLKHVTSQFHFTTFVVTGILMFPR